jgi:DNA repair protein RecO (recombination protein O)
MSTSRLFAFGEFTLYEGREAYSLQKADITNYFTEIVSDIEKVCYGSYFLEVADYFSKEGIESSEMLKLIYQALRALNNDKIPNELVRYVYELKTLVINGEYPEMFQCLGCKSNEVTYFSVIKGGMVCKDCAKNTVDGVCIETSTIYTMQYIITSKVEKLFTFVVKKNILEELGFIMKRYMTRYVDKEFNSLEILNTILK